MAILQNIVPAAEMAARDRDAPMFVPSNLLAKATSIRWTRDAYYSTHDDSLSSAPASLSVDSVGAPQTRPNSASVSTSRWTLQWTIPAGQGPDFEADWIGVFNHNLGEVANVSGGITVDFDVDDDPTFGTHIRVARWRMVSGMGNRRLQDEGFLGLARRFSGILHARLTVYASSVLSVAPRVGEVVFGRRVQLPHRQSRPADRDATRRRATIETYPGGLTQGVLEYQGQAELRVDLLLREDASGLDGASQLRRYWIESDHGRSSVYIPRPGSEPERCLLARSVDDRLEIAETQVGISRASLTLDETPPFYAPEFRSGPPEYLAAPFSNWAACYSSEDILIASGSSSWAPSRGAGPSLIDNGTSVNHEATGGVGGLASFGIGPDRRNRALDVGTSGFHTSGFGVMTNFPTASAHVRVLFRPLSESTGVLFEFANSSTDFVRVQFAGSTSLSFSWAGGGSTYSASATIVNGSWYLLDLIVDPTGGSGGNTSMSAFLNNADFSPADHSSSIVLGSTGGLGIGSDRTGSSPIEGLLVFAGIRPGSVFEAGTTAAHSSALGIV